MALDEGARRRGSGVAGTIAHGSEGEASIEPIDVPRRTKPERGAICVSPCIA